jgi:exopolysaccharide biosynthesis polyprenyl glycosylphosphotransferase
LSLHLDRLKSERKLTEVALPTTPQHQAGRLWQPAASQTWWRDVVRRRLLAFADVIAALVFAFVLWLLSERNVDVVFWSAALAPGWVLLAKLYGLYDRDHRVLRHLTVDELPSLVFWVLSAAAATSFMLSLTPSQAPSIGAASRAFVIACGAALFLRTLARGLWRKVTPPERTVIMGKGPIAAETRRKLELFRDIHARVVGEVDGVTADQLRSPSSWVAEADRVIVAGLALEETVIRQLVESCRRHKTKLSIVPPTRGAFGTAVVLDHVADLPLIEYNTWDVSGSSLLIKRTMDIAVSSVVLVALAPLIPLIALAILLNDLGPVMFTQRRVGLNGRPFTLLKFRTMVRDAEERLDKIVRLDQLTQPMFKLHSDPRVTRVGRILRRFSLDELPQFVNVLRGEMSLVGPRPEQVELAERYLPEQHFRLSMKPGLTGPMQVFGRGELTFDERLAVEREYIENFSLSRDLRLIAHTLPAVFRGDGAF